MKKILIMLCIIFILAGCSKNPIDLAKDYIDKNDYQNAVDTLINMREEDKSKESYQLLIDIYKKEDNFEKIKEVVDDYFDRGYELEDDQLIVKIFSYYDDLEDSDTVKKMLNNKNYNVKIPKEIYIKHIVEDNKADDMEIIEVLIEDINGNGKNEIIVTLGKKDQYITDPNLYARLELMIFASDGGILYHDEGFDSASQGGSQVRLIDFTGDGKKEIYYNQQHFTNFVSEMISILGIQGDKVKELYDSDKEIYDFKCIRLEDTTKVFSKSLRKSYTLERNESMSVYDVSEMRINFKASRIREDIEGLEVGISKQYLLWDDGGGYGHAEYIYGFKNGEMACIDFQFRPNDNVKIRKTKGGISYDLFEEAQNKLIGFWDYEENPGEGQHGERHRIKITDERMIMYVVESERMDKYEYNILDYDENNQIIEMDIGTGICKFKFLDDNIMEITWNNGNKSIWNSVYNVFAQ